MTQKKKDELEERKVRHDDDGPYITHYGNKLRPTVKPSKLGGMIRVTVQPTGNEFTTVVRVFAVRAPEKFEMWDLPDVKNRVP